MDGARVRSMAEWKRAASTFVVFVVVTAVVVTLVADTPVITPEIVLGVLVLHALSARSLVLGIRDMKKANRIYGVSSETVESATVGRTELEGTVHPHEHILDRPLSEGDCLCAEISVEAYASRGGWQHVRSEVVSEPFAVRDETGTAIVEPGDSLDIDATGTGMHSVVVGRSETPPEKVDALIDRDLSVGDDRDATSSQSEEHETDLQRVHREEMYINPGRQTLSKLRFTEKVIEPGEDVFIIGSADRPLTADDDQLRMSGFDPVDDLEMMISDHASETGVADALYHRGQRNVLFGIVSGIAVFGGYVSLHLI